MADPKGFMKVERQLAERRNPAERVQDWDEVYPGSPGRAVLPIIRQQAGRCMDCGIPFCHQGCPLGNLIPEWNDLIHRDEWRTPPTGCTRRTTSPSSPDASARPPARRPAWSASTGSR